MQYLLSELAKPIVFCCLLAITLCMLPSHCLHATHNRAGEISYEHTPSAQQPFRYQFTITTYTKTDGTSIPADRDSLEIDFGDGAVSRAPRTNGPINSNGVPNGEQIFGTNIKKNIYRITHSYPGPFSYVVSMQDPNRIADIININFGGSVETPFYIEDTIFYLDPQFFGLNSSPVLLQPPIDFASVGELFVHNPNAFDADGDSLTFELVPPKENALETVPLYRSPDEVNPAGSTLPNQITLDPATGEFLWDAPRVAGIYNIAFLIREFRNGRKIGTMVRDMQIIVEESNNRPPEVTALNDTCVTVGEQLIIPISANDPDAGDNVTLTVWGGPFAREVFPRQIDRAFLANTDTIAVLPTGTGGIDPPQIMGRSPVEGLVVWTPTCNNIFSEEYTVVVKAEDNNFQTPLVDLETWQITVVPPAPEDLQVAFAGDNIQLFWNLDNPYVCRNSEKFRGFSIWRKIGCEEETLDDCQLGLSGTAYEKIADGIRDTTYVDETAVKGPEYSYRVVADFADAFTTSNPPSPINKVASVPSEKDCISVPRDAPIMTNVSVEVTNNNNGELFVAWTKPNPFALDTSFHLPPYQYEIMRAEVGSEDFVLLENRTFDAFYLANDTTFLDNNLNTQMQSYIYKIVFWANNEIVDESIAASSVFLNISRGDNQLLLNWQFDVPWRNENFVIYRQNQAGTFDSIGNSLTNSFLDVDLRNGVEYCYYVEAQGTYGTTDFIAPLINLSQIACQVPIDTVAPCPPELLVTNDCTSDVVTIPSDNIYTNFLTWVDDDIFCSADVIYYNIYYRSPLSLEYMFLDSVTFRSFEHEIFNALAGCYVVTAVDSFQNESVFSNEVCVENCLDYELPNVFTPNDDQMNDVFVPRTARFVSSVNMQIFNRWGALVYETQDPNINWTGRNHNDGSQLPEGVYYYGCEVFEQTSEGGEIIRNLLNGFIHLIR